MSLIQRLKRYTEGIGAIEKALAAASTAIATGASLLAGSRTLAVLMIASAVTAAVLSWIFTASTYRYCKKSQCLRVRRRYLVACALGSIVVASAFVIADPNVAGISPTLARIRELLLTVMLVFDLIVTMGIFIAVYFVVGGIIVSSPAMWQSDSTPPASFTTS
jgi:hypothetical protein